MAGKGKRLDSLTGEEYRDALGEVQKELSECVGGLVILGGYLESDLSLDSENTHYALLAAHEIVLVACKSVKNALALTYRMM